MITPKQAYEKRYANIDHGQHTWAAAPDHVKDLWLASWTIAWAQAEAAEREACAQICEAMSWSRSVDHYYAKDAAADECAAAIRARGETK